MDSSKVVVITGASSGIGAALATKLGSRGDSVVLAARRKDRLDEVAGRSGPHALLVVTDVTKRADLERLRDAAIGRFGHIDVWVNNAGRGTNRHVEELTEDDIRNTVETVLTSVVYGMQTVLPHFKQRKRGHIINVSSFLGRIPITTYRSIYSASKSAVNILTANLRMDLRSEFPEIHVSVMFPGIVDTPFHEVVGPGLSVRAGGYLGPTRVESADEVADKLVWLIENPVPELYMSPAASEMVASYYKDVGAFENNLASRSKTR
jgi:NADP-dependent 3-hydroxy acid dehydrogenase YdfG